MVYHILLVWCSIPQHHIRLWLHDTSAPEETTGEGNMMAAGSYRGCRHDYIEDGGSFIESSAECEGGVGDGDSSGVARAEGWGVGVCQGDGSVGCEGG